MESPFASQVPPKVLDIAGQTVSIRKLSGLQFQQARTATDVTFRQALLRAGIESWTFVDKDGVAIPVTVVTVDDLDEDAATLIASEVLMLTKPSLQQTADEAEAAQKNG